MIYFTLKTALSNMNKVMSSQEAVLLTLTTLKGYFYIHTHLKGFLGWMWWSTFITPALGRQR
jgi:hypothetical protein